MHNVGVLNEILPGFALNFVIAVIIVGFIYYPANHAKHEYIFTFFVFNVLIYFISGLLRDVQVTLGIGFGLLAVFSILRYRTERIPIKEMSYLFVSITIPFINTLFMATRITFNELIIVNILIVTIIFLVEKSWGIPYYQTKRVLYEKIELIKPEHYDQMVEDLCVRTGLDVNRAEVNEINFLRDTADITIYYRDSKLRN